MREEFLDLLGLDPNLKHPPAEVKKAWRKKCNDHHPDKGGDPQEFIKVTHAYKMLTDPSYRHEQERKVKPETPDLNVRMNIPVTFEEAFFGRKINICFNRIELGPDFKPLVKEEQELIPVEFSLPRGCFEGHQLREKELGLRMGDVVGDLLINVVPQGHQRFKTRGSDIVTIEQLPLDLMIKGGELEVQTMFGLRTLRVPAGTQPRQELLIKRCGVGNYGNHIVVVEPVFPTKDNLKGEAWKGLDINWDVEAETEDEQLEQIFIRLNDGMTVPLGDIFKPKKGRR